MMPTRNDQAPHPGHDGAAAQRPGEAQRGTVLVAVLSAAMVLGGLLYATVAISIADLHLSEASLASVRTTSLAQAGIERTIALLHDATAKAATAGPLRGIQALFAGGTWQPFVATAMTADGRKVGEFSVAATATPRGSLGYDITIDSTGYYPVAPKHLAKGAPRPAHKSVRVTLYVGVERSKVFDYAYFINNWGWLYGNTIRCNGNARSNGQFDVAKYKPTITGTPIYDSLALTGGAAKLSGYHDDNGDGKKDGNDGGIFSGWNIVDAGNVQGNGGKAANQHPFQERVPMPNLTDLAGYEAKAKSSGGKITIGGTTMVAGVYGDDTGEPQNVYLVGTAANPVVITGTVVVRGSVILTGVIKGQGAIYAGGNLYVPNNLTYANPPASALPTDNTQAKTEEWLTANKDKDFVALLARENVVVGNHLDSNWRSGVGSWLADPMNASKEDAGEDQIPNTYAGKDGVKGTEDDDVLEGDGVFTTQVYSAADDAAGLIPSGKKVGDPIPGTGEDIDGDGVYDGTIGVTNLDLPAALNSTNWGGNLPASPSYSSIANTKMTHLDGVFYTNHAFAWVTTASGAVDVNGSVISRNESIIYSGTSLNLNYDRRMLGGSSEFLDDLMPQQLRPFEYTSWLVLDHDPNRSVSQ